jgi:hypothetical protein
MIRKLVLAAGAALVLGLAGGAHAANLITDGDFSTPNTGGGWGLFNFPAAGDWKNTNGDYLEIGASGIYGLACQSTGCQNLEIDANTFDTDSQTVSGLVAGKTYHLSWDYGGRTSGGPSAMEVYFDGNLLTTNSGSVGVWTHNAFDVLATGTSGTLEFRGLNLGGLPSYGNEVTNVSLTGGVPEPATWSLMIGGFALAGAALRRRRAVAVA